MVPGPHTLRPAIDVMKQLKFVGHEQSSVHACEQNAEPDGPRTHKPVLH